MGTVFAFTPASNPTATVAALPAHVKGVSWVLRWSDVEPSQGVYDFTKVEACLQAAHASGRVSMLRVDAGETAPTWALKAFPSVTYMLQPGGPEKPHSVSMCIPTDPAFIAHWAAWYAAYGAKYDGDPRIAIVQVVGLGRIGEVSLGNGPWASNAAPPAGCGALAPLTTAQLVAGWEQIMTAALAAFPHTLLAVDA